MRRATVLAALAAAAALSACGSGEAAPAPPLPAVRMQVTSPADGAKVRRGTVDVRGRVSPQASEVTVLGRPALVVDGRFEVVVPLEPGVNVVDVMASARHRAPALTALRVTRDVLVTVPDLLGIAQLELEQRLEPLGLRADVTRGGGLFDALRSGEPVVCDQEPGAGARVRRGSELRVVVAKRC
ncbi:MAG TPA: PASTA domain-containing protein [Solirubrobacteraceae bacterium]|nr:PASTA domain-containing protein [Solirubrobacteraceae bacterium]